MNNISGMAIKIFAAKAPHPLLKGLIRDIRPTWFLEEIGESYERLSLDPMKGETRSPEYLKINPTGKIPSIVDDNVVLFESGAILEYLSEKFGKLRPSMSSREYPLFKQWNYFSVTNLEPLGSRVVACDIFYEPSPTTDEIRKMSLEGLRRFLKALNSELADREFLLSCGFSVSDILLATSLRFIHHTEELKNYPNLARYANSMYSRPAWIKALELNGL